MKALLLEAHNYIYIYIYYLKVQVHLGKEQKRVSSLVKKGINLQTSGFKFEPHDTLIVCVIRNLLPFVI